MRTLRAVFVLMAFAGMCVIAHAAGPSKQQLDQKLGKSVEARAASEVKDLLAAGANANATNRDGTTVLMVASSRGYADIARILLDAGAKPDQIHRQTEATALILAARNGYTSIMEMLIGNGANVNLRTKRGNNALLMACRQGHAKAVKLLLEQAADPNMTGESAQTALIQASIIGSHEILKALLNHGADPNTRDKDGLTPLGYAAGLNACDLITLMLEKGADIDARDHEGRSPLMYAMAKDHPKAVQLLIQRGADPNIRDMRGMTIRDYADNDSLRAGFDIWVAQKSSAVASPKAAAASEPDGEIDLRNELKRYAVTPDTDPPESAASAPRKGRDLLAHIAPPVTNRAPFRLVGKAYACDSLDVHRELWGEAFAGLMDEPTSFGPMLRVYMAAGNVLVLGSGTELRLTGRANGLVCEVLIKGQQGRWLIPRKAVEESGVKPPPNDDSALRNDE